MLRRSRTARRSYSPPPARSAGLVCIAASSVCLLFGCGDSLRDIDARTDALLRDRIDQLGGGAVAPGRNRPPASSVPKSVSLVDKQPGSVNPGPSELTFSIADERRDVSARLAALHTQDDANALALDLEGALRQAQDTGRELLSAEEEYVLSAIRLLAERHLFSPRLFAQSGATFTQLQTNGSRDMTLRLLNQVGARQRLPFGGELAARWIWDATDQLRNVSTGSYVQSSRLVLDGSIPLLRGAGNVAQENLIQAERDLIYAARAFESFRREYLVSLSRDFFDLLNQLDGITTLMRQVESLETLESRQRAWYQAGRIREFEVNLAVNNLLQARASLANARESLILNLDRFKVRIGLPVRTPVKIVAARLDIPEPETTPEAATDAALAYRLDLQNQRDRLDDAKRSVLNARNALLPDLNLTGSVTFPTKSPAAGGAREGGSVYEFDDVQFSAGATFDVPLDRELERLQLRSSLIRLQQQQREFDRFRDSIILDVRGRTREIERARLNLQLAEQRVLITERRKEEQDLKPDEVTTQEQVDTANDLRDAERARDQAKTDLRNAILDYLVATGTLRVQRDGTFQPLAGMDPGAGPDPIAPPATPMDPSPAEPAAPPEPAPAPAPVPAPAPEQPAPAPTSN